MRFWVVGAHGMLGREVCAALAARELAHIATDRELDIADRGAVERFAASEKFSHVINCAAYTAVDACEAHEALAYQVNADGAAHVAAAARARDAVAVHVSTNYVFDGAKPLPYDELDPTGPINAYGRTKLAGEQRFLAAAPAGYVVRTSWLFGSGGTNFVAAMVRLLRERAEVRVVDDQFGRPTYAPDLAEVLVTLALRRPPPGIYHFANAGPATWYLLAAAIAYRQGTTGVLLPITTAEYFTPARRPLSAVLATDKIERALDIRPRPWREALTAYFEAMP